MVQTVVYNTSQSILEVVENYISVLPNNTDSPRTRSQVSVIDSLVYDIFLTKDDIPAF